MGLKKVKWIANSADPAFLAKVTKSLVEAGLKAVDAVKTSEIAVTSAQVSGVGCNRHDPKGPRDPEVGVLVIRDAVSKEISEISLIYSMHPTVMHEDSKLVSSDFPGYARERLKSLFGNDITVLYHNGLEGNQSPRYDVKGQTFAEAERLGNILGDYVAEQIEALTDKDFNNNPVLASINTKIVPVKRNLPEVSIAEKHLELRQSEFARLKAENAGHGPVRTAECSVFGAERTLALAKLLAKGALDEIYSKYKEVEIQALRIGDSYIAGFPGEVFVEYSLQLKALIPAKTFVIGLANGGLRGYIATEGASGYEADNSLFSPQTGDIMVKTATELIAGI